MNAREASKDFEAGRLSAEQLLDLLRRQECLIQHLHAEVQRLKQRLAQYEPEILQDPRPPEATRPPPPYTLVAEEHRRRPRNATKNSPGSRPTQPKLAQP